MERTMPAIESQDPLEELSRENEVATRLVERLGETALGLRNGGATSPGDLAEGIRLLLQYRRLHARRFDDDLQPEARIVAMPTCFQHLDTVDRNTREADQESGRLLGDLQAYDRGEPGALARLAGSLDTFTQRQYAALQYEGDYPLSCLRATLPEEAARRVRKGFDRDIAGLTDLEAHIERYLARSPGSPGERVPIRCHHEGCAARAEAETYPAQNGYLGLKAPVGWKSVSEIPRVVDDRKIAIEVDYYCPDHATADLERGPRPGNSQPAKASPARPEEEATECPCCNPVSMDLA